MVNHHGCQFVKFQMNDAYTCTLYKMIHKIMFAFNFFWPQMTPPLNPLNPLLLLHPPLLMMRNQERALGKNTKRLREQSLLIKSTKKGHHPPRLTSQLNQREGRPNWNHQRRRKRRRKRKTPKLRNRHLRPLKTRNNPVRVYFCKNNNLSILTHALFQTCIHFVLYVCTCMYVILYCYSLAFLSWDLEKKRNMFFWNTHFLDIIFSVWGYIMMFCSQTLSMCSPFIYHADSKDLF